MLQLCPAALNFSISENCCQLTLDSNRSNVITLSWISYFEVLKENAVLKYHGLQWFAN